MKRIIIIGIVLFALLAATTLAATVTKAGSGITRGSIEYSFVYNANDTGSTVISGVQPNDVLGVVYGYTSGGLPIKREYFMKSRIGNAWSYDILRGTRYLSINLGERVPVNLNNDNTTDLYMEFTNVSFKGGTFTFYNANSPPTVVTTENATGNATIPAENMTTAPENTTQTTETQNATQAVPTEPAAPSEPTATPTTPENVSTQSNPTSSAIVFLIVLLVLLLVIVLGAFLVMRKPKGKKPKKTAKNGGKKVEKAKREPKEDDDDFDDDSSLAHLEKPLPEEHAEPAPQPKLPNMVTRSSRIRRQ